MSYNLFINAATVIFVCHYSAKFQARTAIFPGYITVNLVISGEVMLSSILH